MAVTAGQGVGQRRHHRPSEKKCRVCRVHGGAGRHGPRSAALDWAVTKQALAAVEIGWFSMRCIRVLTRFVARCRGKTGYAEYFKPAIRCLLSDVLASIDQQRRQERHCGRLWSSVRREMGMQACCFVLLRSISRRRFARGLTPGTHRRADAAAHTLLWAGA